MPKGKKYCPRCDDNVPATVRTCKECGFEFEPGKKYSPPRTFSKEEQDNIKYACALDAYNVDYMVYAAAGEPQFVPKNYKTETIYEWCEQMVAHYVNYKKVLLPQALKLFAMQFSYGSPKTKRKVIRTIDDWANSKRDNYKNIRLRVSDA